MTTQREPIRGKIAKILNSREVAVNIGRENGVRRGMTFEILGSSVNEIRDPDTGEVLGIAELPKARVKINRSYDRFAIATTFRTRRVNVSGERNVLNMFDPPKWETRFETLKVDGGFEALPEYLEEKDSYVSVGDPVVQVIDDD